MYLEATDAEPILVRPSMATPAQEAELRRLVALVAADWPDREQVEALAVALADAEDALICFRALAAGLADRTRPMTSDAAPTMRPCRQ